MSEFLRKLMWLPEAASEHARNFDALLAFMVGMSVLVGLAILAVSLYFMARYRRRSEGERTPEVNPRRIHEVFFVAFPLTFFLIWFAMGFGLFIRLQVPPRDAMDVYVQGKKWMWKFAYPGGPNSLDVLRVPARRPVRILGTSRDVIHSFFVPALRIKQDVLPGRYTQIWFTADREGTYDIFCAEYCGLGHSAMLGQLIVMRPDEFDAWIAASRRGIASAQDGPPVGPETLLAGANLVEQGREVAVQQGCVKCHTITGERHIGPTWLDLYLRKEKLTDGTTVIADESYLTKSMMDPGAQIVSGYQNVMPSFQGKMTPPEVAAVVEYIKSLRTSAVRSGPSEPPVYESIPARK